MRIAILVVEERPRVPPIAIGSFRAKQLGDSICQKAAFSQMQVLDKFS